MQNFSSLTPSEQYRINGTLCPETIEALLDTSDALERAEGVTCHIQEAKGRLLGEDFLAGFIDELYTLSKRLRGENKAEAVRIIESAEDLQLTIHYQQDYARDELRKAQKTLEEAGL